MRAFIFPGQGSQSVGMMSDQLEVGSIRKYLDQLGLSCNLDLVKLGQEGPAETINQTQVTQPLILGYSLALFLELADRGIHPDCVAGHSLGEYTALSVAGVIPHDQATGLVQKRGQWMVESMTGKEGAMAAVMGIEVPPIQAACEKIQQETSLTLEISNMNAPGQIVVAGDAQAVQQLIDDPKAYGLKRVRKIPVSVPSHTSLMRAASDQLIRELSGMKLGQPTLDVYQNIHGNVEPDLQSVQAALGNQLCHPVQWITTIDKMQQAGVTQFVECGPGQVLTGILKRISSDIDCIHAIDLLN